MGLNSKGRDWGKLVNWDDLGKSYAGFIISWTVIIYAGVIWLIMNRHLAFVEIRNLPLAIVAVSFLHVYLVIIFLAYTINGHFPCRAEFWIMSIYLPFGIALFQASLVQLRSVFDEQQKYLRYTPEYGYNWPSQRVHGLWNYWTSRPKVQKAYFFIGLGMMVQVRTISVREMLLISLSSLSLVRCTLLLRPCEETGPAMGLSLIPKVRESAGNPSNGTLTSLFSYCMWSLIDPGYRLHAGNSFIPGCMVRTFCTVSGTSTIPTTGDCKSSSASCQGEKPHFRRCSHLVADCKGFLVLLYGWRLCFRHRSNPSTGGGSRRCGKKPLRTVIRTALLINELTGSHREFSLCRALPSLFPSVKHGCPGATCVQSFPLLRTGKVATHTLAQTKRSRQIHAVLHHTTSPPLSKVRLHP